MAGLHDYQQFMSRADDDSPFWEPSAVRRRPPPASSSASTVSPPEPAPDDQLEQYLVLAAGLCGLVCEHALLQPCLVVRHQCQVNGQAQRYHLGPFSLPLAVYRLQRYQGGGVLWKGAGGALLARGLRLLLEDAATHAVVELGPLPQQVLARLTAALLVWPLSAASLTETVQSGVASERGGPLEVLGEALHRCCPGVGSARSRRLPLWLLAPAAALHLTAVGLVSSACSRILDLFLPPPSSDPLDACFQRLGVTATARYLAEALFYPWETVLTRLQVQGTRAIVDCWDSGDAVVAVFSRHDGLLDCWRSVLRDEGLAGLYRGFGALLWQAALHLGALCACRLLLLQVRAMLAPSGGRRLGSGPPRAPSPSPPRHRPLPGLDLEDDEEADQVEDEVSVTWKDLYGDVDVESDSVVDELLNRRHRRH